MSWTWHGKPSADSFFVDLKKLWKSGDERNIDWTSQSGSEFFEYLDDEDGYATYKRRANPDTQLDTSELLHIHALASHDDFQVARTKYLRKHPEREEFIDLVRAHFGIADMASRDKAIYIQVTKLTGGLSVTSITSIFETMNTTGQRLTAFEIVNAILFGSGISIQEELEDYKNTKMYYKNLDPTGELVLQTIALLTGQTSKKNELPRTINAENYRKHIDYAVEALDLAGRFLSERFCMWLDRDAKLLPYPAILAPLGIALAELYEKYSEMDSSRENWFKYLERWFVGSVFSQSYRDSQPATQRRDVQELRAWIDEEVTPSWLANVEIPVLDEVAVNGAAGKLIICLVNLQDPKDPMDNNPVGGKGTDIGTVHVHHVFPKAFCLEDIGGWPDGDESYHVALNLIPISNETNLKWSNKNPSDHVAQVRRNCASDEELTARYLPYFIDGQSLDILEQQQKTFSDYKSFIALRGKAIQDYVASTYSFRIGGEEAEEEDADEE